MTEYSQVPNKGDESQRWLWEDVSLATPAESSGCFRPLLRSLQDPEGAQSKAGFSFLHIKAFGVLGLVKVTVLLRKLSSSAKTP